MIQTQPATVADFTGGLVDDYINAANNTAAVLNNFVMLADNSILLRPGSEVDVLGTTPQIPGGSVPVRTLINYNNSAHLIVQAVRELFYRNPTAYSSLLGPSGNWCFDVGDDDSVVSHTQWQGHLYLTSTAFPKMQRVYKDSGGILRLRTAGLPALATDPVVTAGAAGASSYLYAFLYSYEYTVGNQTFLDYGATTLVELSSSDDPSVNNNAITAIPVLANGVSGNWDTSVIKVEIYRTTDGGTVFYKLGEVTNGTTVFTDSFSDSLIEDNEIIYTEGGVVENDEPPRAKYIHVVQNRMYAAYLKEGTEILPGDYLQSVPNDPDSFPATFRDVVEDTITGFSSVREIPIILCKRHVYRVEGVFDELGRGGASHVRIHDTAGCVAHNSCVQAEGGMYWAGNDGFYYTDGYKVFKVSDSINVIYRNFIKAMSETGSLERITGTFDEENRRILWTVQRDSASLDNDSCFMLDLRRGPTESMPFGTWDGVGETFRPTAMVFFNKELYRGDTRGYVLRHSEDITTDPRIDALVPAANWAKSTIIYTYRSMASNFGTDFVRKWVTRALITCKNRSNISIQMTAINDDGKYTRDLAQIRFRLNFVWGNPEFAWGDPSCVWGTVGMIEEWRRMPARGLRCSYMQLEITNAYSVVTNSDTIGTAVLDPTLKTVTLTDSTNYDWPLDAVDYYISFENDNYTQEFLITDRANDVLTFSDVANNAPASGTYKWLLKGFVKGEVLNLLSYTIHFAHLSKTQANQAGSAMGENA